MRILMLATHDFRPPEAPRVTVKCLVGQEYTVKRSWGAAMVKAKVARQIRPPRRPKADA